LSVKNQLRVKPRIAMS